jgi:nicotinamidase-related amidase
MEVSKMASNPRIRNPATDHLLTPQNCALVLIDIQPIQIMSEASRDRRVLVSNIVAVARTAKLFGLPVIISTTNVASGRNAPMIRQLADVFPSIEPIDRTAINAWEDEEFVQAVNTVNRRKLVIAGLWTEGCVALTALDAIEHGYDVYLVVDASAGTSMEAHCAGLQRMVQAGARPTSWVQLICELQRDWDRSATIAEFAEILFSAEGT